MTNSLVTSVLLASGVGELREELVEQLQPAVETLVETVVKFVLATPSPAATLAFEQQLEQQARELNRLAVAWAYNRPEADGPESLPHDVRSEGDGYRRLNGATPALLERVGRYLAEAGATQDSVLRRLREQHNVRWGVKRLRAAADAVASMMDEHRQECQVQRLLELLQQEGVRALDLDAEIGELADAEVSDVLGDQADDLDAGIEVTGQDGLGSGGDVDVLGGAHRRRHAGELDLDLPGRDLRLGECCPHELFVPARRLGVGLAAGVDERPAHLVEDQRAPVKADQSLVVQVDQQATGGGAEQGVGVGNDWDHGSQPAKISSSRSAPS